MNQLALFDSGPILPDGFRYTTELIDDRTETALVDRLRALAFREFEFHGFTGKRRVVSFGWHYDFNERVLRRTEDMPPFLVDLREVVATFAGIPSASLQHVLVTEYSAGAGIGWHRDKAVFGEIVGLSLLAPCVFRLRRRAGDGWDRVSIDAEPRSAYLLSGAARTDWEHSIPPVDATRYSITYRNLRED